MYLKWVKRFLDVIFSILALVVLSPLMLVLAICIKIDSKGPIFFKQKRVGKNKKCFMMYKFRTMCQDTPKDMPTHLLQDPKGCITKLGVFLRKSSLDELPQLFNILAGQMSIIGPRPALWNQDDLVAERDKYSANDVRPGLSGYAQAHGRDELPIPVKAEMDGYYVQNLSFSLDVKILFDTFRVVAGGKGVVEGNQKDVGQGE